MPGQTRKTIPAASKPTYGLGLANKPTELQLPSGAVCLAIRPGAQGLIKAKLLDSLDSLTSIVQVDHIDANDPKKMARAVEQLSGDTSRLIEGLELLDKVVAYVVREPKVFLPEYEEDGKTEKPRDPNKLYADDVDPDDKLFIFQWSVGGSADLETFRKESKQFMGPLSAGKDV